MIDVENEVFNTVAKAVRATYKDIHMVGEYVMTPPKFPSVSLVEMDNQSYQNTEDSGSSENHASLMYEVDIYSNKKVGKKAECKAIAKIIDEQMLALGFVRRFLQPIPNLDDATIYRIKGRYSAIVSKDEVIYRR